MSTHVRRVNGVEVKIHTSHICPPIPDRSHDWSAVDDNYDCDHDGESFVSSCPHGWGSTEEAAIADYIEQAEERAS